MITVKSNKTETLIGNVLIITKVKDHLEIDDVIDYENKYQIDISIKEIQFPNFPASNEDELQQYRMVYLRNLNDILYSRVQAFPEIDDLISLLPIQAFDRTVDNSWGTQ